MPETCIKELLYQREQANQAVIIELGPGETKITEHAIGIDRCKKPSVDHVADLDKGLDFLPSESVDTIHAYHFLEHISDPGTFIAEIERVLKPGGRLIGSVPHFSNPYFYSDYTHRTFWGLYSLSYFCRNRYFTREVPQYYNNSAFILRDLKLVFASPFPIRNRLKKVQQWLFNRNRWIMEFYEEQLVYYFPCYEIRFDIEKSSH